MLRHARPESAWLFDAVEAAGWFHDLGKLDPQVQAALRKGRAGRLCWDHIDAGVAHVSSHEAWMAAWLIRSHHAPGLPERLEHFNVDELGRRLRGRRHDEEEGARHDEQIARTNDLLPQYLAQHEQVCGQHPLQRQRAAHGLAARLALSCLVDADHSDTAGFDSDSPLADTPPLPRWTERLEQLCRYVRQLPAGDSADEKARNRMRAAFFESCLAASFPEPIIACEGPVGLGKTTAVAAYLLRRAYEDGLRRLFVIAPYTNILTQTASRLREALVLPGERASEVVAELHHRADLGWREDRDLAATWRAPIILTTAVAFFETLSACEPGALRKLHSLPGSAVMIDEAHAALPAKLWPQYWLWVRQLAERWGCRFVLASGSLVRFWEDAGVIPEPAKLPELLPPAQAVQVLNAERCRVHYRELAGGNVLDVATFVEHVRSETGPRLVILNTVQNAAIVARAMHKAGMETLHLSTALTPRDRKRVLMKVEARLKSTKRSDWALVATSCVEAGIDVSFRCAFRERFSASSLIQVGGRVNRHGESNHLGGGNVYDVALSDGSITQHPAASESADILYKLMKDGLLDILPPADVVTQAMRQELAMRGGFGVDLLAKAERDLNYPAVQEHGRVIQQDTRLVVVDNRLKDCLTQHKRVSFPVLLRGSVQLWAAKVDRLGLPRLDGRRDVYYWPYEYEPNFLGIMAGVLKLLDFCSAGGGIV